MPLAVAYIVFKALLAIGLWGAAVIGFGRTPLHWSERLLAAAAAVTLIAALPLTDEIGFALRRAAIGLHFWRTRAAGQPRRGVSLCLATAAVALRAGAAGLHAGLDAFGREDRVARSLARRGPANWCSTKARVRGSGAGMEPPDGAVLQDGWWVYRTPQKTPLRVPRCAWPSRRHRVGGWRLCTAGRRLPRPGGLAGAATASRRRRSRSSPARLPRLAG